MTNADNNNFQNKTTQVHINLVAFSMWGKSFESKKRRNANQMCFHQVVGTFLTIQILPFYHHPFLMRYCKMCMWIERLMETLQMSHTDG